MLFNCGLQINCCLENTIYQTIIVDQHSLLTKGLLIYMGLHNPDN